MRQRIDIAGLWLSAREQAMLAHEGVQQNLVASLPTRCPLVLDDLRAEHIDGFALPARLTSV